ncbi:hypothetical protein [Streptomyces sp. CYG21]|uniref:hypothetical protein n=1 Tax=Streptomyces sp. CYG21 TaxID=2838874 RepID=UPI001C25A6BB|nr:hypothetical protein [Streptomyces sp. CYG21]
MDAKRGDIGSTMGAYAATYLDKELPPLLRRRHGLPVPRVRFAAVRRSTRPAVSGAGVFVLALTSNPEGAEVQRATAADGRSLAQLMLDHMAAENAGAGPRSARSARWSGRRSGTRG